MSNGTDECTCISAVAPYGEKHLVFTDGGQNKIKVMKIENNSMKGVWEIAGTDQPGR
jgi:hypothetical protein